jgi:AraC-like DNA-binding protein
MIVKAALQQLGLRHGVVDLGEVEMIDKPNPSQLEQLRSILQMAGLELMDDKKAILIEKIKGVIVEMIHYADDLPPLKNSVYISQKLNHSYTYLANLFSETTGITIEHFIIIHKIEKVKELLLYDEMNLTEISYQLHYSSVSHLSNQFKKITGLTPSYFKKLKYKRTKGLEDM